MYKRNSLWDNSIMGINDKVIYEGFIMRFYCMLQGCELLQNKKIYYYQ